MAYVKKAYQEALANVRAMLETRKDTFTAEEEAQFSLFCDYLQEIETENAAIFDRQRDQGKEYSKTERAKELNRKKQNAFYWRKKGNQTQEELEKARIEYNGGLERFYDGKWKEFQTHWGHGYCLIDPETNECYVSIGEQGSWWKGILKLEDVTKIFPKAKLTDSI